MHNVPTNWGTFYTGSSVDKNEILHKATSSVWIDASPTLPLLRQWDWGKREGKPRSNFLPAHSQLPCSCYSPHCLLVDDRPTPTTAVDATSCRRPTIPPVPCDAAAESGTPWWWTPAAEDEEEPEWRWLLLRRRTIAMQWNCHRRWRTLVDGGEEGRPRCICASRWRRRTSPEHLRRKTFRQRQPRWRSYHT